MTAPDYLVCGTIPTLDAGEGFCCRCLAKVWPTKGSLAFARAKGIALVCLDCAAGMGDDYQFAGVVDHGRTIEGDFAETVTETMEAYRTRRKRSIH